MSSQKNTDRPLIYLLAIEDVARSPLVRSQVCNLLKALREQTDVPITLVSLYPVVNWFKCRDELNVLRDRLATDHIGFHVVPLLYLTRYFYIPTWLFVWFWIQILFASLWISLRLRPALVHCRSYPAAVVGKLVKRFCRAKLLFDTRALYPEEGATLAEGGKSVLFNEASFAMWKRIEQKLVKAADKVTVVSTPSVDILTSHYSVPADHIVVVPTTTTTHPLTLLDTWRAHYRAELGLSDEIVVAYVGSWFEPEPTMALFRQLIEVAPDANFFFMLIVSSRALDNASPNESLSAVVRRELGLGENCIALSLPQPMVARYLACADIAAQPVGAAQKIATDPRYKLTARTRLSIKFTEYLACGLPVLVNRWAGAAADIVAEHDLGLVYDEITPADMRAWLEYWKTNCALYRQRAWNYARENFAIEVVAQRYLTLYQQLLDQN